jgi:hypothetical protein
MWLILTPLDAEFSSGMDVESNVLDILCLSATAPQLISLQSLSHSVCGGSLDGSGLNGSDDSMLDVTPGPIDVNGSDGMHA